MRLHGKDFMTIPLRRITLGTAEGRFTGHTKYGGSLRLFQEPPFAL
jgi:hypothetical protein